MKVKFNHYERVAGMFVLAALLGSLAVSLGVALKKGWFASKVQYMTVLESADGLHEGTLVQVAGLRAGQVTDVELVSAQEVRVTFKVFEKFQSRIREDSLVSVIRPFIIGEKVLEISVGSESSKVMSADSTLTATKSFDVMDLVSGRKLGPFLGSIEALSQNLRILAEAFADPERTKALVAMFDRLDPLLRNMNSMALGVTKITDAANRNKRIEQLMSTLTDVSVELNQILPIMAKQGPAMAAHIPRLVENLAVLTDEFKKLTPAITAIAPELPQASKRAIEALDEAVVTLKAMQKSFFLRGNAREVREEESSKRQPASGSSQAN